MLEIQNRVKKFCDDNKLSGDAVVRLLDTLSELGEVSKEILKSTNYGKNKLLFNEKIEDEIGDLFFSLITLSNELNIDLGKALEQSIKKYEKRLIQGGAGSEFE